MIDFQKLILEQYKLFADPKKYFELFDKHITGDYKTCLIYAIGNAYTIASIMRKNPDCRYYIYDDGDLVECIKVGMKDFKNFKIKLADSRTVSNEQMWRGVKDMNFDRIIMNPPYSKNLHLKILAEAIKHLKDEKSVCVNLSPA